MTATMQDAITVYSQIIEQATDGALAMLLVDLVGEDTAELFALARIDEDIRPATYIEQVAVHYASQGRVIEQMILQNEAWLRVFENVEDGKGGEEAPLREAATFTRRHRDGTEELVIVPFTRMGDGTINWREPEEKDDSFEGEVIDAMRKAMQ